jgi:hypothetical protein
MGGRREHGLTRQRMGEHRWHQVVSQGGRTGRGRPSIRLRGGSLSWLRFLVVGEVP